MDAPSAATLVATAKAFLDVFSSLDGDSISDIQTEGYRHEFAPQSLDVPGPFNAEQFTAHLKNTQLVMSSFPVYVKQIWPNPYLHQVVAWTTSEAIFHENVKDGSDDGEWQYHGEYIWILTMNETGTKVDHVLEFLDSKGTEKLLDLVKRARKMREINDAGNET